MKRKSESLILEVSLSDSDRLFSGVAYCMSFQLQPNTICAYEKKQATSLLLCLLKTGRHISNSSTRRTPEAATSAHMQAFPPGRCKKKKKMERSPRLSVVRKSILTLSFCRRRLRVSLLMNHPDNVHQISPCSSYVFFKLKSTNIPSDSANKIQHSPPKASNWISAVICLIRPNLELLHWQYISDWLCYNL